MHAHIHIQSVSKSETDKTWKTKYASLTILITEVIGFWLVTVPVSLYKRAQILIADVWGACEGKGLGEFRDIDTLTMFADYR